MAAQGENVININGVPFGLSLARLKTVLHSYDVTPLSLKFEQEHSNSSKTVVACMSSAADVLVLLKKGTINCTLKGKEHSMKIDLFTEETNTKEKNDNEKTSEKSSKADSEKDSGQEKNSRQMGCVHCTGLTNDYMNGTKLTAKFSRFGQVNQVLVSLENKFAVVKFQNFNDAINALKTGVTIDVGGKNTRILSLSLTMDLSLREYNSIENTAQSQQRSLYCTRIPKPAFNNDALNQTFIAFGPIRRIELHAQSQPYALVTFVHVQSARKAMSCSEIFTPWGAVHVDWNKREKNDIRQRILNERKQKTKKPEGGQTSKGNNERPTTSKNNNQNKNKKKKQPEGGQTSKGNNERPTTSKNNNQNKNKRGRQKNRGRPTSRNTSQASSVASPSPPPVAELRYVRRPISPSSSVAGTSPPPTPGNSSEGYIRKEIYCKNIPEEFYNRQQLMSIFARYGHVEKLYLSPTESKYAIVAFREQSVAETLMKRGLCISQKPLTLRWSNKAYTKQSSPSTAYGHGHKPFHVRGVENGDRAILVSNLGPRINHANLRHYFANNARSGGGKIVSMEELPDGVYIVFEDPSVLASVLEMKTHEVEQKKLKVFAKTQPKQLQDRFLITGLSENVDMTILEMFLENCDKYQNAPKSYERISRTQLMVIYDFRTCGNVERIRVQVDGKSLENLQLLARPVFQTDCLKVEGLKKETSDSFIELFFANVQRSGGKDVTFVDRRNSGSQAFVFFANCNVVDRIVARSLLNKLEVDGRKVQTSHCYNYLQVISEMNAPLPHMPLHAPLTTPMQVGPNSMTVMLGQNFRIVTTCKWYKDTIIGGSLFCKLKFRLSESDQSVTVEGDPEMVALSAGMIRQYSNEIVSVDFGATVNELKRNFVRFCLEHPSQADVFRGKCQLAFREKSITASVEKIEGNAKKLMLLYDSIGVTGPQQIEAIVSRLVYLRSFSCDIKYVKQAGKKWSEIMKQLFQEGVLVIFDKGTTSLLSLTDPMSAQARLNKCIKEFSTVKKEVIESTELERVLYTVKYYNAKTCKLLLCGNNLQIEGTQGDSDVEKPMILRFFESLKVQTLNVKEVHLNKLLQSEVGLDFLRQSQTKHKIIILKCTGGNKVPINQKKKPTNKKKAPPAPSPQQTKNSHSMVYEGKLKTNKNVTVKVIEGNIVTIPCDAVVNTTNKDLQLEQSGISGSILKKGGSSIQDEMNKLLRTIGGVMFRGDAVVSGSGNLPCKKLIHTYGPNWNTQVAATATKYLKSCVVMCLTRAQDHKLTSIAIPLIGGGGCDGGDAKTCTQHIMEAISDHFAETQASTLNQVYLVPTAKMVEQFVGVVEEFSDRSVFSFNGSIPPKIPSSARQLPTKFEIGASKISVEVLVGDITGQTCDVMITSTVNFEGAIIKAIAQKVDSTFMKDLSDSLMRTPNVKIVATDVYSLPCSHLLHLNIAATPNEDVVTVKEALLRANFFAAKSIAIPAFGGSRLSGKQCAELTTESIKNFLQVISRPSIEKIYVVLFKQNFVDDYKRAFANLTIAAASSGSNSSTPTDDQKASSSSGKPTSESIEKLIFCGKESAHNHLAIKELVEYKASMVTSKRVENDLLMNKEATEKLLKEVEDNYHVDIKLNVNKYVGQAVITGLRTDVDAAFETVLSALHKLDKELTNSKFVQWKFCDISGKDIDFNLKSNYLLESNFQIDPNVVIPIFLDDGQDTSEQTVDFSNMTFNNGGITMPIFRELVGSPKDDTGENPAKNKTLTLYQIAEREWMDMDGNEILLVELQALSVEYTQTLNMFKMCGLPGAATIYKISRLQNTTLYKQFHVQKSKVESRLKGSPNTEVTRRLFHGTNKDSVESILANGFDRSHAGNGSYGRGVYFATQASYSHSYSVPGANGHRYMFLVDVVTGEYCQGRRDTAAIPIKPGSNEAYDCVVDRTDTPNIFVVFKDSSAYALYLLEYS